MSFSAKNYLLILLLSVHLITAAVSTCQTLEEKLNSVDSMIGYAMQQMSKYLVGLSVGIVVDGQIVSARGYGLRNISDSESRVTNRTIFAIGSSTKSFTSFAVDLLRKDGVLDWSDPVIHHIPEFRVHDEHATNNILIKDLAAHLTGLPRHDLVWDSADYPRNELLKRIPYLEPSYDLRERFQYNNIMVAVEGIVVERASNSSTWEDFVSARILKPLRMTRTYPQIRYAWDARVDDIACGHVLQGSSAVCIPYAEITTTAPCGAIVSTAEDMSKWVRTQLLLTGRSKEMHRLHTPIPVDDPTRFETDGYGYGWFVGKHDCRKTVEHGGSTDGFTAYVTLFPDDKLGVVVLDNMGSAATVFFNKYLSLKIADILHGCNSSEAENKKWVESQARQGDDTEAGARWEKPSEKDRKIDQPDQYVGSFANGGYGILSVSRNGFGLAAFLNDNYTVKATKIPDQFYFGGVLSQFKRNSLGDVIGLHSLLEPAVSPIFFEKIVPAELYTMKHRLPFVGVYGGSKITIAVDETGKADENSLSVNGSVSKLLSFANSELVPVKPNWFSQGRLFFEFVFTNEVVTELVLHRDQSIKRFRKD